MVWPLAQSVYNIFEQVKLVLDDAAAKLQWALSPIPPGPPSPPSSGGGGNTGSTTPIPENPYVPPTIPPGPPPVVEVPSTPIVPTDVPQPNCPPLSLADTLAIYGLQYRSINALPSSLDILYPQIVPPDNMIATQASGIPLEQTDYFRFRALSTSDSVPVTFYGRIQLRNKQIVPFSSLLTTATAGTLYETTLQGADGYLLGAAASVPVNSITTGVVSAVGEVGRIQGGTFTPHTLLFSGQLNDLTPLTDSSGSVVTPVSGGTFKLATNGGSGTELTVTLTPASGKQVRVLYTYCSFTNSAIAGPRAYVARFRIGGVTIWRETAGQYVQASQLGIFQGSMGGSGIGTADTTVANGDLAAVSLPETLYFNSAVVVSLLYDTPQVGDALSGMFVGYEES